MTPITPEDALQMANTAMTQANNAINSIAMINTKAGATEHDLKKVAADATIARNITRDLESGHNAMLTTINDQRFKTQQLEEGHRDLNMALSETNERLEILELMMQMQTTAPIAAATDVEAELVDQLLTAEGQLDQALQLIYDIRKRARETGAMNTNEWMDLGQRSVAILELHKLI